MDSFSNVVNFVNGNVNFASANHIRVVRVAQDYAETELTVVPESMNPLGFVHGGCLFTLADITAGSVVRTRGTHCVTLNSSVNFLRSAKGAKIRGIGRMVRCGKTVAVCDIRLLDENDQEVFTGTFTYYLLDSALEPAKAE